MPFILQLEIKFKLNTPIEKKSFFDRLFPKMGSRNFSLCMYVMLFLSSRDEEFRDKGLKRPEIFHFCCVESWEPCKKLNLVGKR